MFSFILLVYVFFRLSTSLFDLIFLLGDFVAAFMCLCCLPNKLHRLVCNHYFMVFCVVETAINIGFSCRLLTNEMKEVFVVEGRDVESVTRSLTQLNEMIKSSLREYRGLRDDDEVDFVDGKVHTSGLEVKHFRSCLL